jgi:carbohydrate kinase (thermoresistant glucokinase family)
MKEAKKAAYIIAGVSGSGKTTIGTLVAEQLKIPFIEADDFHSQANKEKMKSSIPLVDDDRWPWLKALSTAINKALFQNDKAIVACSALKLIYRDFLIKAIDAETVQFIILDGSEALLFERLKARKGHFMPPTLLKSQLDTLQTTTDDLMVPIEWPRPKQVEHISLKIAIGEI